MSVKTSLSMTVFLSSNKNFLVSNHYNRLYIKRKEPKNHHVLLGPLLNNTGL
ncbi:hypothetical protein LAC02_33260 [Ligilactobacillus acidipiscis]|nr:hypothetical protein LAC02_33260 [Ligilactobacillus acidipiscis]